MLKTPFRDDHLPGRRFVLQPRDGVDAVTVQIAVAGRDDFAQVHAGVEPGIDASGRLSGRSRR